MPVSPAIAVACLLFSIAVNTNVFGGDGQASAPPDEIAKLREQLAATERTLRDWPDLARYRDENTKLPPPEAGESRVVFIGDSITDRWGRQNGKFFPRQPGFLNRGIGGQITGQMLERFQQDVIQLQPQVVVILAGTNDIPSKISPQDTEANLISMAELARVHRIKVVFASLLPVSDCYRAGQTTRRPLAKLQAINGWIEKYCNQNHLVFLDYFKAMSDDHGLLKCEYTFDGVHPGDEGYDVMEKLAAQAIAEAIGEKSR